MAKQTLKQRLQIALTQRGATVVRETTKYLVMSCPSGHTYWLGASGALRRGRTTVGSLSLTDTKFYHELLAFTPGPHN